MAEFNVLPPLIMGLVIGIYEIILLHRDVTVPTHKFAHGVHAVVFAVIATFATMNAEWAVATFGLDQIMFVTPLTFQIAVGIIAAMKIHGVSAAIKTTVGGVSVGIRETWFHSFLIGGLIVAAPYIWPVIQPIMPEWAQ